MFNNDWKLSINAKSFEALDTSLFKNYKFSTLVNFAFFVVFLSLLKALLFVSDVYTCVKLLAFNTWSNNIIQPYIPFRISKWLFSACILASVVLMIWEVARGIAIYRTRNISLTYVNNFSRAVYSLTQYDKFCIYNRITPKGTYQRAAFFTFFELKDCLRLLFADTPRQVINGLTLWSVLIAVNSGSDMGKLENLSGLIAKIETIAKTNREEAVILSFMLFSFVVWAFFISKLILACVCSIFVYYHIFNERKYGGLKEYVCVTVSDRVDQLVKKYENKRSLAKTFAGGVPSAVSLLRDDDLEAAKLIPNNPYGPKLAANGDESVFESREFSGESKELSLDYEKDALQPTSAIRALGAGRERPVVVGQRLDSQELVPKKLTHTETLVSAISSRTLPSVHFGANAPTNAIAESFPLEPTTTPLQRPRPPPTPALDTASLNFDTIAHTGRAHVGPAHVASNHVYTPEQAYFGGRFVEQPDEHSYPQRSTSVLDRRQHIENEDYQNFMSRVQHTNQFT